LDSGIPTSGRSKLNNSGFNGNYTCPTCDSQTATSLTNGINFPNSKYYNLYDYGTTYKDIDAYGRGLLGDATIELGSFSSYVSTGDNITRYTSTWSKDYANAAFSNHPWIIRGGYWYRGSDNGIFAFSHDDGTLDGGFSFRTVLVK